MLRKASSQTDSGSALKMRPGSPRPTSHAPEALFRLTESYLALGVIKEAEAAAAVLGHNFPESKWYETSYALLRGSNLEPRQSRQSWLARLF